MVAILKTRGRGCRKPQPNRRGKVLVLARVLRTAELCAALGVDEAAVLRRGELAERLVASRSVEEVEAVVVEALRRRKLTEDKSHLASTTATRATR